MEDKCTLADLACFSWVNWAEWAGVSMEEFPLIKVISSQPKVVICDR